MDWDTVQQVFRIVLNAIGAALVSKGYLNQEMLTALVGGILSIGSVAWWFFWNRNKTT